MLFNSAEFIFLFLPLSLFLFFYLAKQFSNEVALASLVACSLFFLRLVESSLFTIAIAINGIQLPFRHTPR